MKGEIEEVTLEGVQDNGLDGGARGRNGINGKIEEVMLAGIQDNELTAGVFRQDDRFCDH